MVLNVFMPVVISKKTGMQRSIHTLVQAQAKSLCFFSTKLTIY